MGVTPPHLRTSNNLFVLQGGCLGSWKRMVCGSEFIVGSFENRIYMCAHVKCWSRLVVSLSSL